MHVYMLSISTFAHITDVHLQVHTYAIHLNMCSSLINAYAKGITSHAVVYHRATE